MKKNHFLFGLTPQKNINLHKIRFYGNNQTASLSRCITSLPETH